MKSEPTVATANAEAHLDGLISNLEIRLPFVCSSALAGHPRTQILKELTDDQLVICVKGLQTTFQGQMHLVDEGSKAPKDAAIVKAFPAHFRPVT